MRILACLLILTACGDFPAFDGTLTEAARAAPFPTLVPLDPLLAAAAQPGRVTPASVAAAEDRVAGLRARAAGLRGSVLSGAERDRLDDRIDISALR